MKVFGWNVGRDLAKYIRVKSGRRRRRAEATFYRIKKKEGGMKQKKKEPEEDARVQKLFRNLDSTSEPLNFTRIVF